MIKVKVTKDHIFKGTPEDSKWCPIALSLHEKFEKQKYSCIVNQDEIYIENDNKVYCFGTPHEAKEFIDKFDYLNMASAEDGHISRQEMNEFEFELTHKDIREVHEKKTGFYDRV